MWLIFRTDMLITELKANLDVKTLFGTITHLKDPKISKMPVRGLYGNFEFQAPFWSKLHSGP